MRPHGHLPLQGLAALVSACSGDSSPMAPGGGGGTGTGGTGGGTGGGTTSLPTVTGTASGGAVQVSTASGLLATVGGAALVQSPAWSFLVNRTGASSFTALTAICTHEQCTVTGLDGMVYVCPCHGSRYNSSGQVLTGPAPSPLQSFATAFSNNTLTITV